MENRVMSLRSDAYRLADLVDRRYLAPADLLPAEPEDATFFCGSCDFFGHD